MRRRTFGSESVVTEEKLELITSSGTWIAPEGLIGGTVSVFAVGGGGAGARRSSLASNVILTGGNGGEVVTKVVNVTAGNSYTITIGSGGTGGKYNPSSSSQTTTSTAGGDTSFGDLVTAAGGTVGSTSTYTSIPTDLNGVACPWDLTSLSLNNKLFGAKGGGAYNSGTSSTNINPYDGGETGGGNGRLNNGANVVAYSGTFYGAGGGSITYSATSTTTIQAGDGYQGCIILSYLVEKPTKKIYRPQLYDYVYSDKTWSTDLDSTKTCVGIITDVRSMDFDFMALNDLDKYAFGLNSTSVISYDALINNYSARLDFDGKSHTESIVTTFNNFNTACKKCYEYSTEGFPTGDWFLPAAGQFMAAVTSTTEWNTIQSRLVAAGGTRLYSGNDEELYITSSLFSSNDQVWGIGVSSWSSLILLSRASQYHIRPFCTLEYNHIDNGIYICDKDNNYYSSTTEWTNSGKSNDDAIGVAVVTDNIQFLVSKVRSSVQWGTSGHSVTTLYPYSDVSNCSLDCHGTVNTRLMYNDNVNTSYAAGYCKNYTFGNGATGYLASPGEWLVFKDNRTTIVNYLKAIGAAEVWAAYWTSAHYTVNQAWEISNNITGTFSNFNKTNALNTIPFGLLPIKNGAENE